MIFICLGTQDFQFNRLLEKIDRLIEKKVIEEEVFAQVGYSDYIPSWYNYKKFINFEEFDACLDKCNYVITHGGTGTIIKAIRKNKKVIAVPRLKKHSEHVDDHQKEIIATFSEKNLVYGLNDVDQLEEAIRHIVNFTPEDFVSGNSKIISILSNFIKNCR